MDKTPVEVDVNDLVWFVEGAKVVAAGHQWGSGDPGVRSGAPWETMHRARLLLDRIRSGRPVTVVGSYRPGPPGWVDRPPEQPLAFGTSTSEQQAGARPQQPLVEPARIDPTGWSAIEHVRTGDVEAYAREYAADFRPPETQLLSREDLDRNLASQALDPMVPATEPPQQPLVEPAMIDQATIARLRKAGSEAFAREYEAEYRDMMDVRPRGEQMSRSDVQATPDQLADFLEGVGRSVQSGTRLTPVPPENQQRLAVVLASVDGRELFRCGVSPGHRDLRLLLVDESTGETVEADTLQVNRHEGSLYLLHGLLEASDEAADAG